MATALRDQVTEYNLIAKFFQADLGVQCVATKTDRWREFFSKDLKSEWQQAEHRSDVYWTPNSFKSHQRGLSSIVQLNAFYVDLDCYKIGMSKDMALQSLNMVLDDNNLFQPTMIIDSGNGLQLIWKIESIPVRSTSVMKLWNRIEKEICARLSIIGSDSASTDASRVLRVPGTYNTKGTKAKLTHVIEFNEKAVYEMRDFQNELLPVLKRVEKKATSTLENPYKKNNVSRLFNSFTLNKSRLSDLETLLMLRENDALDMRNIILFLMANFIENGQLDIDRKEYIYNANATLKSPLNRQEIETIVRNADGKYNYKNQTLIELLQVTNEEQRYLKTIISTNEYDRRQRSARKERYKPIKQSNEQQKENRNKNVREMYEEGKKQQEIADLVGISKRTVATIVKEYKKCKKLSSYTGI